MLNTYLAVTQALLGTGSAGNLYPQNQLVTFINIARHKVAHEGECIRALPSTSGPITAITVTSGGTGYVSPTVIVSAPDSPPGQGPFVNGLQASAQATVSGGSIIAVTLLSTGSGYFSPAVSFSDVGTGAVAIAVVSGISQTSTNQEVYPFSALNPVVATSGSGIATIHAVNSISIIWGTFRYVLMRFSFSKYQAKARTFTNQSYSYLPAVFCQFGQGESGSVYMYPPPNQPYPMEWDCVCTPIDLATDSDPEAIPGSWTECVPFLAAYYATTGAGRYQDADRFYKEYERFMKRARQSSNPRGTTSWYGRG